MEFNLDKYFSFLNHELSFEDLLKIIRILIIKPIIVIIATIFRSILKVINFVILKNL